MRTSQEGFSLAELMISMAIMLMIAGSATMALMKMTNAQATIWNRTQMHSGIRGATEVLQQEVGQAGRVALPAAVTLSGAVSAGTATVTVSSVSGMFVGEKVQVDAGCFDTLIPCTSREEIVTLTAVNTSTTQITAVFVNPHATGAPVQVKGVFASGVVPPLASPSSFPNGSSGTVLKLYGDINADGNMVYVEYTCNTTSGNLYRKSIAMVPGATKVEETASQILLSNITANPDSSPCFTYQTQVVSGVYYVTDVAITLTVRTQLLDPVTKQFQTETKALLNVSPRNVFNAWTLASLGMASKIQVMPPIVTALLPCSWLSGGICV